MRDCLGENLHLYYPYITRILLIRPTFVPSCLSLGLRWVSCVSNVSLSSCQFSATRYCLAFHFSCVPLLAPLYFCCVLSCISVSQVLSRFRPFPPTTPCRNSHFLPRFMFVFGAFVFFQTFLPTIPYGHSLFGVSKSHNSTTRMRNTVCFLSLLCELLFIVVALKPSQSSPFVSPSCLNPRNV